MASIGTGYDLSASTYSPVGRVFQVEYAYKAVENAGTAIALRCKDGIVFAVEKVITSKMLEPTSNKRIIPIDRHVGMAVAGLLPDGRQVATRARKEAAQYKEFYDEDIPLKVLTERVSGFVQAYTLYGHIRPFGCTALIGGIDRTGPRLFMVEPSGVSWGYSACAAGKAAAAAKTDIEKLKLNELSCEQGIVEAAKIIYNVHDDLKDKMFILELAWVCPASKNQFSYVPANVYDRAKGAAEAAQESDEDEMDEGQ